MPVQVELLKGDLDEMVYIMAGSPRLLESYMLDTGALAPHLTT